ncbi:OprD family outer membrane porin [Vibrio aestuarianus]|uniref:OprD family outer membrane porin n=1 Tax=Vibrio aestuarianus TaxID=28171 RepID=A0AAX3U2R4_9VIBR|nr:OprD family outer membrane porin [Vibrio aestuarianus]MDE1339960.1 OprD family outer membrane porin [Vibrio aestuarianus]WGK81775.1 OprD family outer membrane porin [Vibrio aestuarianus]
MKRTLTRKTMISSYIAVALGSQLAIAPSFASVFDDSAFINDSTLSMKLRNEYRHAERPSANDGVYGPEIDAWVQGFLFDFESGKIADTVSIQAGSYIIEKLRANPDRSTRMYLDGHESFTINYANLSLDFGEKAKFKIGQFGTDYFYGTLDYSIPLIDNSSVRTAPSLNEGAFYEGKFGNFRLYGMYSQKYAGGYYQNWTDEGFVTDISLAPTGDKFIMDIDKKPQYTVAGLWDNKSTVISLGASYQEDLSWQAMSRGSHSWVNPDVGYFKAEYVGFYAESIGLSLDRNKAMGADDSTYVVSGQLLWNKDKVTVIGSAGQTGPKLPGNFDIDTDLGFSFDQSIDRNHYDTFSWQLGSFYKATDAIDMGLALVVTDGYEDRDHNVNIEGLGANLILSYTVQDGPLKGLKTMGIFNKAQEYREGSKLGDKLDYYDIKVTVHYDFNLF